MQFLFAQAISILEDPLFTPVINFLTIIILALTAYEAFRTLRASTEANELSLLPLIAVYFRGKIFHDRKINIRNIGNGAAYDIWIQDYIMIITDAQKVWKLTMKLSGTNILVKGEEKQLTCQNFENGKLIQDNDFLLFHLDPEEAHPRESPKIYITFKNAKGVEYYCRIKTGPEGLSIILPSQKLDIWGKIDIFLNELYSDLLLKFYQNVVWKLREPYLAQPRKRN